MYVLSFLWLLACVILPMFRCMLYPSYGSVYVLSLLLFFVCFMPPMFCCFVYVLSLLRFCASSVHPMFCCMLYPSYGFVCVFYPSYVFFACFIPPMVVCMFYPSYGFLLVLARSSQEQPGAPPKGSLWPQGCTCNSSYQGALVTLQCTRVCWWIASLILLTHFWYPFGSHFLFFFFLERVFPKVAAIMFQQLWCTRVCAGTVCLALLAHFWLPFGLSVSQRLFCVLRRFPKSGSNIISAIGCTRYVQENRF